MSNINYKKVIEDRHTNKIQIKFQFWKMISILFLLLLLNVILIYIGYDQSYKENSFFYKINTYFYWLLFFNNSLIGINILNIYYMFKNTFSISLYSGEKKRVFNEDGTLNIYKK